MAHIFDVLFYAIICVIRNQNPVITGYEITYPIRIIYIRYTFACVKRGVPP